MRLSVCFFAVLFVQVAGCATVGQRPEKVTLSGEVTDRREVAAAPMWPAPVDYTRTLAGAVGVLAAQLYGGTPRHYVYTVESANGPEYSVPTTMDVAVGSCLAFSVSKAKADQHSWNLDEVGIEPGGECLTGSDSAYDATVQQLDANGNNGLHLAIWTGSTKRALRIIGRKSVDLNSVNNFGATALHLAVAKEDVKIAQALIDAGANPTIRDNGGATPAMDAINKGNREILDLLKKAAAG